MEQLQTGKGSKSMYLQIKEIYKDKIIKGEIKRGEKLPSEMEIQQEFGVSRITARQAVLELEQEGMVKRGRGKGTFVIWRPGIEEELTHIKSFTEEMKSMNRVPGTASLKVSKIVPDRTVADIFGLEKGMEVYCIKRVRTADEVKMVYLTSYFPLSTNLPLNPDQYSQSIYTMLDYSGVGIPKKVEEKISAVLPDKEVADALKISETMPVLLRERISYDDKGKIIELTYCYYRGDLYKYTISTTN
ncbi:GntR family transcriptional regulator [Floccifex sp.]|uniref:GntR family transcriptional regulator n=1 Tax=Floccifex sp. TaxID=2815810 RepID=UPI0029FF19C5|nr:UTRA domain-containing protein [Floccifex sp.]MDD7281401.1 GntR family transcriptional regulator [Erysipelotrichaceae bacterium]MDY2957410.1 GntR family transcriptional regulator [Floccifex sp.]